MRPGDVALTTAAGKQTSILEVLDEMRADWSKADQARQRARSLRAWTYGRFGGRSALETVVTIPSNVPAVTKNKLRSLLLTWASRTVKRRDTAMAYANEATQGDLAKAEVANAVLDYMRQSQDRDALMMRAMMLAGTDGLVALYNTQDPDAGPHREREVVLDPMGLPARDEAGAILYKEVEGRGNPNLEALSIFDFITSGEHDAQKGKWCLIRRWLDVDEAETILRAKSEELGLETEFKANPVPIQNENQSGVTRQAVEAWEMWWRPNKLGRFPEGFFAAVVSDVVVTSTTFPYEHGELPLVVIRVMDVPDDFYGATWMEDAMPQQAGLNHSLQVLAYRAEVTGQVRTLMRPGMADKWGDSNDGHIECASNDEVQNGVRVVETPDIPKDMYELAAMYEKGIDDTAGVSAVASSGDIAAATKNARLVAYATQIDEQKNEHTLRNLQEGELVIDTQQLRLVQQFMPLQRLIRVIGEDNAVAASWFSGAEIRGVDALLFAAPGAERTRAARGQNAEEATAAGFLDPAQGAERRETGLSGTLDQGEQRQRIHALMQQAMSGQPVQADPTIDPDIAVRELRMAVERASGNPQQAMPLRSLLQEYTDLAAQGAQQQMPQPGAPAAPGGLPEMTASNKPMINQLPSGVPS